jgi:hypothetical protein
MLGCVAEACWLATAPSPRMCKQLERRKGTAQSLLNLRVKGGEFILSKVRSSGDLWAQVFQKGSVYKHLMVNYVTSKQDGNECGRNYDHQSRQCCHAFGTANDKPCPPPLSFHFAVFPFM